MDILNMWFHWAFSSPGYFLLVVAGLCVFFGLIGGLTDSQGSTDADQVITSDRDESAHKTWWAEDDEHYREWQAHQVREQHRKAHRH
jgi:hypothetical protein